MGKLCPDLCTVLECRWTFLDIFPKSFVFLSKYSLWVEYWLPTSFLKQENASEEAPVQQVTFVEDLGPGTIRCPKSGSPPTAVDPMAIVFSSFPNLPVLHGYTQELLLSKVFFLIFPRATSSPPPYHCFSSLKILLESLDSVHSPAFLSLRGEGVKVTVL